MLRSGVVLPDLCENGGHRDTDESEVTVQLFFCCNKMFLCKNMFVCKVLIQLMHMIEIHVRQLCRNKKDKCSCVQLMNYSLPRCLQPLNELIVCLL